MSSFDHTFGANTSTADSNGRSTGSNNADKPKAKVWLNIGYETPAVNKDGESYQEFITLPQGIPLDTMTRNPTNQRDEMFRKRQAAGNAMLDQLLAAADKLKPGEERLITLVVQMRRVRDDAEAVPNDQNELIVNLGL